MRLERGFSVAPSAAFNSSSINGHKDRLLRNNTKTFEDVKGFPVVVGVIDGTHIPIKAPIENPNDYINRKFSTLFSFKTKFVDFN